jgi:2-oxoglutarate dehydrogenase E1 component
VREIEQSSFLYGSNAVFIEELYLKYLNDRSSVDPSWLEYFDTIKGTGGVFGASWGAHSRVIGACSACKTKAAEQPKNSSKIPASDNYFKAKFLVERYRERGHYLATLDPLGMEHIVSTEQVALNSDHKDFDAEDLSTQINLRGEYFGLSECTLGALVHLLRNTYAKNIGFEFAHLDSSEERNWLYSQVERPSHSFASEEQKELLQHLVEIEGFEQYLHIKFPGAKRFSIEGVDAAVLSLQKAIEYAADSGTQDVVLGMAHRGRLSTLTKVMKKPYRAVFSEFIGISAIPTDIAVSGDVKYHIGYSSDTTTKAGNKVHLSLAYNPSHLEAVNPVVAGKTRAQQDITHDAERRKVMCILVHGDAAFCGQGVVSESLIMSGLEAYNIGGTLHIITNNQVGFTANPQDQHPGRYATEVAKIVNAPIIHVNGDDIESVIFVTDIAIKYRNKFGKDIVLDIIGYRKYGHNEGDEPMYTQPVMYDIIKTKATPAEVYAKTLVSKGVIAEDGYQKSKEEFKKILEKEYDEAKNYQPKAQWLEGLWSGYKRPQSSIAECVTGVDVTKLKELGVKLCTIPENFALNAKLSKLFEQRKLSIQSNTPIDWATAEQLAFASLLSENTPIRLTGEDVGRGTFSHRHSVLHSQTGGGRYIPLNNLSDAYAKYEVADSNLSEYAVLGFEYGYSLVNPKHLVIWEAQFGDFANGAQIIFDQFISSAETKWLRMSGLVVLLPHGFEGMGPEHSSARLERFLQLAAEDNIQVVNPTTPASIFHVLRRQMCRDFRKPLIVMTPKSLLRHKLVTSDLNELSSGTSFKSIIGEIDEDIQSQNVQRVIICSGKVYYDLLEVRRQKNLNIAIIRIEQYYPFHAEQLTNAVKEYKNATEFIWCQEEPQNMGAWYFIKPYLKDAIGQKIQYIGRNPSASPAVGSLYLHNKEQQQLVHKALNIVE